MQISHEPIELIQRDRVRLAFHHRSTMARIRATTDHQMLLNGINALDLSDIRPDSTTGKIVKLP
jgi:hypothetical protein